MTQGFNVGVKSEQQTFQRFAAQIVLRRFKLAARFDQRLPTKKEYSLWHIVADYVAFPGHAQLHFLLPAGGEHRVEIVAVPAAWLGQVVAHSLAAAEHLVNVVGGGEQRVDQRIVGESLAVDVDRAGQGGDQAVAIAERVLERLVPLLFEAGGQFEQWVDQLTDARQRRDDRRIGRGRWFQQISDGRKQAHLAALLHSAWPALAPLGRFRASEIQSPTAASLARSTPGSMPRPSSR